MATTSEVRAWWAAYECDTSKYTKVAFPAPNNRTVNLLVAAPSQPVWEAVAQIMLTEPYLFRETAGGTYNCRNIAGSTAKSIHAYALAIDINPSKNPHKVPLTTDMPASFIARMEGIKANGKKAITWGGRWSKPDAMHFQINVAPADCKNVTWDQGGGDLPLDTADKKWIRDTIVDVLGGDKITMPQIGDDKVRTGNAGIVNSVWHASLGGKKAWLVLDQIPQDVWALEPGGDAADSAWLNLFRTKQDTTKLLAQGSAGGLTAHEHQGGTSGPVKG